MLPFLSRRWLLRWAELGNAWPLRRGIDGVIHWLMPDDLSSAEFWMVIHDGQVLTISLEGTSAPRTTLKWVRRVFRTDVEALLNGPWPPDFVDDHLDSGDVAVLGDAEALVRLWPPLDHMERSLTELAIETDFDETTS